MLKLGNDLNVISGVTNQVVLYTALLNLFVSFLSDTHRILSYFQRMA